ncbi:OmpA family protein [Ferruginibacter sp.]|uniref:OmpA family protein n=1 Tax=Ferruginibacter sp. TaxID=1940288 RepID=UPI0019CACD87|nr:OmpA family protein [Ferruginibacter sp.]MBC7627276.1 OmpA family protein [Ferruginibacter sp.]
MPKQYFYLLMALIMPVAIFAQSSPAAPMNLPKDAPVNVSIADAKSGNLLSNEIVVFKSRANGTEFQGLSDSTGKFTVRLPNGTKYDIYILGFHDSTSYNVLDIPALKDNQYYKNPFNVDIQFEAPKSFVLDNCTFETGKATLQPEAYKVVDELVEYLKRKEDEKIEVGGHTDNVGKPEANMILSTNRANTVRTYLLTKGIAPERVTFKGYGITVPIAENDTAEGRALNRRTEVKIIE